MPSLPPPSHTPAPRDVVTILDRPAPLSQPAAVSAFGAHGIWAPGVLLMRRLRFAPKMGILMAALIAAIAVPATAFFMAMRDQIAFSARERDGVRYLRALYPALLASLDVRRDASAQAAGNTQAPLAQSQARLQTALDALQREEQTLGAALGTQRVWSAVQQATRSAQIQPGQPSATYEAFSATPAALIQLAAQACDGSNLTLDPEVHTYYIMDAVCFRLPETMERTGAMRGGGASALVAGALAPALRERIAINTAVTQFQKEAIKAGLAKTLAERPAVASRIPLAAAQQALGDFIQRVRTHVLDASTLDAAQAPQIVAGGNAALDAQRELTEALLPLLDELLAERVAAMQRDTAIKAVAIAVLVLLSLYLAYCFYRVNRGGTELIQRHLGLMAEGDLREPPPTPSSRRSSSVTCAWPTTRCTA